MHDIAILAKEQRLTMPIMENLMARIIPTGAQSFVKLRQRNLFYVDKTKFIQEWWECEDDVTLITRPRRFGKTLMLDTVNTFFSLTYAGRNDLFEGLEIWNSEKFRILQWKIPVIFLSFSDIKCKNYKNLCISINDFLVNIYNYFRTIINFDLLLDT